MKTTEPRTLKSIRSPMSAAGADHQTGSPPHANDNHTAYGTNDLANDDTDNGFAAA